MNHSRVDAFRKMLEARPDDARARFGLATEYEKQERWEEAVAELRLYLNLTDDEGNAYGRLGRALRELERDQEAREAYRHGIEAAYRHGHPSMAQEFEEVLDEWEES